ncbi:Mor transcription activator family protein [Methylolobus aquaticus]
MEQPPIDRELLKALRAEIVAASVYVGISVRSALDVAARVEERLTIAIGGQPQWASKAERNALIRRDWNGRNVPELMEKYQVGRTTLYRIVSRAEG